MTDKDAIKAKKRENAKKSKTPKKKAPMPQSTSGESAADFYPRQNPQNAR